MKQLLNLLCNLDGVSGFEDEVVKFIINEIKPYATEMYTDALGNLIVFKKGAQPRKQKLLVCAHTDEVGFLVKEITEDGYIKLASVGSIDPRLLIGKKMKVGKDKVNGIISLKAIHLSTMDERKVAPKLKQLFLDTGCSSKGEVNSFASLGDTVTFATQFSCFGEDLVKAKAIDDRVGCACLIKLIQSQLKLDTYFAFTSQEEIGSRGAIVAANRIQPDVCVVVEGTSACDLPDMPRSKVSTRLGMGAVVSVLDQGTVYPADLSKKFTQQATAKNIKWQYRQSGNGGNDAAGIHLAGKGCKVFGLSVPVRYIHSPNNVANLSDIYSTFDFANMIVNEWEN